VPMETWTKRWGYEVRPTDVPGVLKTRDGGWLVYGKVRTLGRKRVVMRTVREGTIRDAQRERLAMLDEAKAARPTSRPRFSEYAPSLYERKVAQREIKSAKSRERWDTTLRLHLLPAFGRFAVDEITKLDIETWKTRIAGKIARGQLSPRTANGWLSILRVVIRSAVDDYELERDPTLRVKDFSTEEHPTYTDEEPNALTPLQARAFLVAMRRRFPHFYAMVMLGFVTGLRPSTLRPLRRRGGEADVLWKEGAILVRRSNSLGQEVMNTTKTNLTYKLGLPPEVMAELRLHASKLRGSRARSDLLFPSKVGGLMSRSALDKPFRRISKVIGLGFTFTPRGMRRTYQDVGRAQGIEKNVRKAVCGHATDEMSDLYSTIRPDEMRKAVARIARAVTRPKAA
jgi:hypothetical protein